LDHLDYTETPVQEIHDLLLDTLGVRLLVKREDLNHPQVSGNKWWKLKHNLVEAKRLGKKKLLTFGGAYSNHIYATAAAAKEIGLESIGIIRGEETLPLNSTLTFAKAQGMELHYISREAYRNKTDAEFLESLVKIFGDFYLIPEGGTNALAVKGCEELGNKILSEIEFDIVCLPVGTGGTMAGLISSFAGKKQLTGIAALKGGEFLKAEIDELEGHSYSNWNILANYHQGGYAKITPELSSFLETFQQQKKIPLEPVYTGKLMWAIFEEIKNGKFKRGTTILALHTGGLQTLTTHSSC
jgi:1-aminocyclopropane-1-carboxylate deaminase